MVVCLDPKSQVWPEYIAQERFESILGILLATVSLTLIGVLAAEPITAAAANRSSQTPPLRKTGFSGWTSA